MRFSAIQYKLGMAEAHQKSREYNPEKALADHMIEQYYNYISLLKITNNFEKKISFYENINLENFQGKIAIIGNTTQISHPKQALRNKYYFPVIQTTLNNSSFIKDESSRRFATPIKRMLAVTKKNYHQIFLLPFNKVIAQSKKQKKQCFIFTGLKMYFYEQDLYFFLTKDSTIIQLQNQFYHSVFRFLQNSLGCKFAQIDLRKFYSEKQLLAQHTFSIQDVRTKIYENFNQNSIVGLIHKINKDSYKKRINQKEKQVQLIVHQEVFSQEYTSYGACRIYIRFDMIDEDLILNYLQEGKVYIFKISDIVVGENFQIYFKINRWKDNIIKVANCPAQYNNIQQRMENITAIPLKALTNPIIYRNYYKFHVTQVELKFFYLKVCCEHCENSLIKVGPNDYQCMNECGIVNGSLKLWVIVGCMDKTYNCEATIQDENVLQYFDINEEAQRIKQQMLNAQQIRKGVTLYFKRDREEQDDEYDDAIIYQKHPYLMELLARCLLNISDKYIVGVPKASLFQSRNQEDQEDLRLQYLISFAKAKQLNKKLQMFLNGQIRPTLERSRFVPQIKVHKVYPYSKNKLRDQK